MPVQGSANRDEERDGNCSAQERQPAERRQTERLDYHAAYGAPGASV